MSLEIVFGPMFSGKSTYALSYIRRQRAIGKGVIVIKPNIDNRYSYENVLVTHNMEKTPCLLWNVSTPLSVISSFTDSDCIVFEEAQFLTGLSKVVQNLLCHHKKNILIVGLDGDAQQNPFGEIFQCIPWATNVRKLNALCYRCKNGTLAPYTRKFCGGDEQVDVGGSDKYESVCLKHLSDQVQ